MAKGIRIGVNNTPRKVKKIYVGVNGVPRKVKKVYIGVGGVAKQVWSSYGFDSITKLANPAVMPTGRVLCSEYSPDGSHLAVGHEASPYLSVYKIEGNKYTKLPNVYNAVKGNVTSLSWHPNGQHIACAVANFTGATDVIVTIEPGSVALFKALSWRTGSISFHPSGDVLVTGDDSYLRLYSAATGGYLGNIFPNYSVGDVKFSPDGLTLYAEAVREYSEDPNEYRMVAFSVAGSGTSTVNYTPIWMSGFTWSTSDYRSMNISVSDTSLYMANAMKSGGVEIGKNRSRLTSFVAGMAPLYGIAFGAGGEHLIVVGYSTPFVKVYKRVGDTFTEVTLGNTFNRATSVAVNQINPQVAIGLYTSPFLELFTGG